MVNIVSVKVSINDWMNNYLQEREAEGLLEFQGPLEISLDYKNSSVNMKFYFSFSTFYLNISKIFS